MSKKIILTTTDYKQLMKIISVYKESHRLTSAHLKNLSTELESAVVLDEPDIPDDVVSINSTVVFKNLETGISEMVTVVLPTDTDKEGSRISILSPLGTALIGEQENAVITCFAPAGETKLRIERIVARHTVINH